MHEIKGHADPLEPLQSQKEISESGGRDGDSRVRKRRLFMSFNARYRGPTPKGKMVKSSDCKGVERKSLRIKESRSCLEFASEKEEEEEEEESP